MKGSFKYQISNAFREISQIGESKHSDKLEAKEKLETAGLSNTWHGIGKEIGIYSYKTQSLYFRVALDLANYAKENFKVKDITLLKSEHVNSFLQSKIDQNLAKSTVQQYTAAIEKFETAINKFIEKYQSDTREKVNFDIQESRKIANENLTKSDPHRAYNNPESLISAIKDSTYQTLAQAQLESGARVREINHLKLDQLNDSNRSIEVRGKGGYRREIKLSESTYLKLKEIVTSSANNDSKFIFSEDKYRNSLKEAATTTRQSYTGTHGLRWNFAQNEMIRLQRSGFSYDEARAQVSSELGHHRLDITSHYLQ